jgi:hypothetical protein
MQKRKALLQILPVFLGLLHGWVAGPAAAQDNVDPGDAGAQSVYQENAGWLNAEPKPPGGALPGVLVTDSELFGYVYAENLGWISLSCQNTGTCGTVQYGVLNDGNGGLSGLAWGENVGWIDFRPAIQGTPVPGTGVRIDPATGTFTGYAWGENLGWLNFGFTGPSAAPFRVTTSWRPATPTPTVPPAFTATATPTRTATHASTSSPTPTGTATATAAAPQVGASVETLPARLTLALALAALLGFVLTGRRAEDGAWPG